MLFNSTAFLLFLPVVLVLHRLCPRRVKSGLLLIASWVFYAFWDVRFLSLLVLSTAVDFVVAGAMEGAAPRKRRALLAVSLVANLGLLGVFKYLGFFVAEMRGLLAAAGLGALDSPALDLVLPMGISFYTFQTLAYTIDVYRGTLRPCRNPIDYALFVAYFPQLVAGPIERASRLLPQIEAHPKPTRATFHSGLALMVIGLFKKVVMGDGLLAPYVDTAFADPGACHAPYLFLAALLFSLELYFDFSGYSDIARGVSRMLGIELMVNFTQPLLSVNIAEFWRRWHVSLSTWLRDYLYVPLGGNRGPVWQTYRNLMLTMLLGGLWHGASWNFVLWGGLHGVYLALHRAFLRGRRSSAPARRGSRSAALLAAGSTLLGVIGTNLLVAGTLILFRAPDLATAGDYFAGLAPLVEDPGMAALALCALALHLLVVLAFDLAPRLTGRDDATELLPGWARTCTYAILGIAIWTAWPADRSPFIYFQF